MKTNIVSKARRVPSRTALCQMNLSLESERDTARALVAEYVAKIDRLYNHNEAVRQAVITHCGLWHSPTATEIVGIVQRQQLRRVGHKA